MSARLPGIWPWKFRSRGRRLSKLRSISCCGGGVKWPCLNTRSSERPWANCISAQAEADRTYLATKAIFACTRLFPSLADFGLVKGRGVPNGSVVEWGTGEMILGLVGAMASGKARSRRDQVGERCRVAEGVMTFEMVVVVRWCSRVLGQEARTDPGRGPSEWTHTTDADG